MIAQGDGGRIINITSVHEDWPMPGNTAYCLSKGGMRMLTRTAGVELAPHGITVVGVGPGAVDTPINSETEDDPAAMKTLDTAIPLGRMAKPEEIGSVVAFLACDGASYLTATTIFADGGIMQCEPRPCDSGGLVMHRRSSCSQRSTRCHGRASQMAFTLAFHIILVPLGVSWAFMALIANYRGIKRERSPTPCVLAQRWSKYMAVTFAVGAVTGTVLTFEFGLLWPRVHGPVGRRVRHPVRVRGALLLPRGDLHLDLHLRLAAAEALGALLDRRPGRARRASGGTASVVAANAWMNEPVGFTLDSRGQDHDGRPGRRDLQQGDAAAGAAHDRGRVRGRRVPDRVGLRDRGCSADGATGYHRLGFIIPFTVAAIVDADPDARRATRSRAGSTTTSR